MTCNISPLKILPAVALIFCLPFLGAMSKRPPAPPPVLPVTECGAETLSDMIGKPLLALDPVPENARVIRPFEMITQDFRPERLNIELDENDVILRVRCG